MLVLLLSTVLILWVPFAANAASLPDVIDSIRPSIVAIGTVQQTRRPPAKFRGTGFVVGNGRYVVTNDHVLPNNLNVGRKEYLAVFIGRGQNFKTRKATIIKRDREHDLALLKISGKSLAALRLGSKRKTREGQPIAFTGFPIGVVLGLFPVTHTGIISALTPNATPVPASSQLDPNYDQALTRPL